MRTAELWRVREVRQEKRPVPRLTVLCHLSLPDLRTVPGFCLERRIRLDDALHATDAICKVL